MAYTDSPSRAVAVGGVLLAGLAGLIWKAGPVNSYIRAQFVTSEVVGNELLGARGIGQVALALKQSYPDSYKRLAERYAKGIRAGEKPRAVDRDVGQALAIFINEHKASAVQAPDEALMKVADAQAGVIDSLMRVDATACGAYARGNTTLASTRMEEIGANFDEHYGKLLAAIISAAKAGETNPVSRKVHPPTADERRDLTAAVSKANLSPNEQAILNGRMRPEAADDTTICTFESKARNAVAAMPRAKAAAWVVRTFS